MKPTIAKLWIRKNRELFPKQSDSKDDSIPFVYLELEQFLLDHARVYIKIDITNFGKEAFSDPLTRISLINEKFEIDIMNGESKAKAYGFLGLITDVQVELDKGEHSWMYIYGASRSIELERGQTLRTYSDMKLKEIVSKATENISNLQITCKPEYDEKIPFSMQYYETDFQYLRRLAWMYKEKFFFSGDSLVFGQFDEKDTVTVHYDDSLTELKIHSRLRSNRFQNYYHNKKEERHSFDAEITKENTFTGNAEIQSDKLNPKKQLPVVPFKTPVYDDKNAEQLTLKQKQTNFNRMFSVTGQSKIYSTRIGGLIQVQFKNQLKIDETFGTLRLTRVKHCFEQNDKYYNEFEACQTIYPEFPYMDIEFPVAQPIEATVLDNQDKDGLGKVRLIFDFEDEICDHWFRCLTPDAGGNKNIGKERNRGFIFVPEIGDRILIGFIGGNPDKPYVMGSLFHGNNAKNLGGGKGNHIRSISDKANNYIQWNSAAGIKIMDRTGVSQVLLDGEGNIIIHAPKKIGILAGKDVASGSSITMTERGEITITGADIKIDARKPLVPIEESQLKQVGDGQWKIFYKDGAPVSDGSVTITSTDYVHVNPKNSYMLQAGYVNIDTTTDNANFKYNVVIKGEEVQIN